MNFKITKKEVKFRFGLIALSFFTLFLVEPIRGWINTYFNIHPLVIGFGGILLTLYIFDL